MPEKRTMQRARRDRREGKAASTQAGEFVQNAVNTAFMDGFHAGCWVSAGVVFVGSLCALAWLPSHAVEVAEHAAHPEPPAEPALYVLD